MKFEYYLITMVTNENVLVCCFQLQTSDASHVILTRHTHTCHCNDYRKITSKKSKET